MEAKRAPGEEMLQAWGEGPWQMWLQELSAKYAQFFQAQGLRMYAKLPTLREMNHLEQFLAESDSLDSVITGVCDLDVYRGSRQLGTMRWQLQYQEKQHAKHLAVRLTLARAWTPVPSEMPWAALAPDVRIYPRKEVKLKNDAEMALWLVEQGESWPKSFPSVEAVGTKLAKRIGSFLGSEACSGRSSS